MSQQSLRRSVFRWLLSVLTQKAPEPVKEEVPFPQHPAPGDRKAWHTYWAAKGQPWRSEPEIDTKRQRELERCRTITPVIEQGIYPFSGMSLSRADVEWLLASHESAGKRGPVDWYDPEQRGREGLDLRGADLHQVNLRGLPLAHLTGASYFLDETHWRLVEGVVNLEGALLEGAHLEEARLSGVHLEKAQLSGVHLEHADLSQSYLEDAQLHSAHLEEANFEKSHLKRAYLQDAHLERANLREADLTEASLIESHLEGADLTASFFDEKTKLNDVALSNKLDGSVSLADVHWGDCNVGVIDWSQISILGDEYTARDRTGKFVELRISEYETAVRANHQLAIVLQAQ